MGASRFPLPRLRSPHLADISNAYSATLERVLSEHSHIAPTAHQDQHHQHGQNHQHSQKKQQGHDAPPVHIRELARERAMARRVPRRAYEQQLSVDGGWTWWRGL